MRSILRSGTPVDFAVPADAPRRGLVILPDIGGLGPSFERIANDLVERCGIAVAVVELFPENQELSFQERLEFGLRDISEARVLADATEAADLLTADPVAVMGFCIGGALAMRAATLNRFDRIVSWYGMVHLPPAWAGDKGDPLQAVAATSAPVVQIAGDSDDFITAADLDELEEAGASVARVPGVKHAFAHDPSHPNHDPVAASASWDAVVAFLAASEK